MRCSRSWCGTTLILGIAGEIDLAVDRQLGAELARAVAVTPETLVVDLTQSSFIALTGAKALGGAQRHAEAEGVELVILATDDMQRQLRRIAALAAESQQPATLALAC